MAEEKIGADPHFRYTQPFDEHGTDECFGIPLRQLASEADYRHAVDPGAVERGDALLFGHQQRRRFVGTDDLRWMRVKGHRHGDAAMLDGAALHALDDLEMSAVQAVEVTEREHGMHEPRWSRVVRKM